MMNAWMIRMMLTYDADADANDDCLVATIYGLYDI